MDTNNYSLIQLKSQHNIQMLTRRKAKRVECSICLELSNQQIGRIQCRHNFCYQCIREWVSVKNWCPLCRRKITKVFKLRVENQTIRKYKQIQPQNFSVYSESQSQSINQFIIESLNQQRANEQADQMEHMQIQSMSQQNEQRFNLQIFGSNSEQLSSFSESRQILIVQSYSSDFQRRLNEISNRHRIREQ